MARTKNYQKRCFEGAFDAAYKNQDKNPVICHGFYRACGPFYIGHAWVEIGGNVIDYTIQVDPIPMMEYYQTHQVFEPSLKKYSLKELSSTMLENNHMGPFHWDSLGDIETKIRLIEVFVGFDGIGIQ